MKMKPLALCPGADYLLNLHHENRSSVSTLSGYLGFFRSMKLTYS
jgi:hypothetical protein